MKRIKLEVAYDGTNYCGWQVQPNGPTIEGVLNKTLTDLLKEPISVIGASRTDSGVHALANVAVFDTESKIPGEKICFALNQRLPEDIIVQASGEIPMDFHPRFCASRKTYQYKILNCSMKNPLERFYSHFVYMPLNTEWMKQGADYLLGEHDFKSFCSANSQVVSTVRTIYSIVVEKDNNMISFRITGNGFLYNMVRIIAGTLIEVGLGKKSPEYIKDIIEAKDRAAAGPKAPAQGLTLIKIEYLS